MLHSTLELQLAILELHPIIIIALSVSVPFLLSGSSLLLNSSMNPAIARITGSTWSPGRPISEFASTWSRSTNHRWRLTRTGLSPPRINQTSRSMDLIRMKQLHQWMRISTRQCFATLIGTKTSTLSWTKDQNLFWSMTPKKNRSKTLSQWR